MMHTAEIIRIEEERKIRKDKNMVIMLQDAISDRNYRKNNSIPDDEYIMSDSSFFRHLSDEELQDELNKYQGTNEKGSSVYDVIKYVIIFFIPMIILAIII